jgi:hypothetical protein
MLEPRILKYQSRFGRELLEQAKARAAAEDLPPWPGCCAATSATTPAGTRRQSAHVEIAANAKRPLIPLPRLLWLLGNRTQRNDRSHPPRPELRSAGSLVQTVRSLLTAFGYSHAGGSNWPSSTAIFYQIL